MGQTLAGKTRAKKAGLGRTVASEWADFALGPRRDVTPLPARLEANHCLRDSAGCGLAAGSEATRALQRFVERLGSTRGPRAIGCGLRNKRPPINGLLVGTLDYNDICRKKDPSHMPHFIGAARAAADPAAHVTNMPTNAATSLGGGHEPAVEDAAKAKLETTRRRAQRLSDQGTNQPRT